MFVGFITVVGHMMKADWVYVIGLVHVMMQYISVVGW